MGSDTRSGSVDAALIGSYFQGDVSSSIVYLLTLFQPLKEVEIRSHPYRLQYLRLREAEMRDQSLDEALDAGQKCGVLVALSDGQEDFFFLNSDLGITPPSLGEGEACVQLDPGTVDLQENLCLPGNCQVGKDHPIPLIRDPSAFLGWFQWLSDKDRRDLLAQIQERGPLPEEDLLKVTAIDKASILAGLRCGVLKSREGGLDFQFSAARIPPDGQPWTEKPPRFWLSRSYEPLQCVENFEGYLGAGPARSPMQLLGKAVEDGKRVLPAKRRDHLRLNLLYHSTAHVPRIEDLGPETIPTAWENRRGLVYPVTEGYERALAMYYLHDELQPEGENAKDWRREALRKLAHRKLERYFQAKEEELLSRRRVEKESTYGLGPNAILSVASSELEREGLVAERKYFEKFLELLAE